MVDALRPLFDNTENFYKNHKIEPPKTAEESKKEENKKEGGEAKIQDAADQEQITGWDNATDPMFTIPEATPAVPTTYVQNQDLRMDDDNDSNKAHDEGQGEHIYQEEHRGNVP